MLWKSYTQGLHHTLGDIQTLAILAQFVLKYVETAHFLFKMHRKRNIILPVCWTNSTCLSWHHILLDLKVWCCVDTVDDFTSKFLSLFFYSVFHICIFVLLIVRAVCHSFFFHFICSCFTVLNRVICNILHV